MSHCNTVLSQVLKLIPRHEFTKLEKKADTKRRRGAFSRWSQFLALTVAQLTGRSSLRDIEMTIGSQKQLRYHLGCQQIKKSTLARANENLSADFYQELFGKLYQRCCDRGDKHKFRFKGKLFSLDS